MADTSIMQQIRSMTRDQFAELLDSDEFRKKAAEILEDLLHSGAIEKRCHELMEEQLEKTVPTLVLSEVHRVFTGEGVSPEVARKTAAAKKRATKPPKTGGGTADWPDKDCPECQKKMEKAGRGYKCADHGTLSGIIAKQNAAKIREAKAERRAALK